MPALAALAILSVLIRAPFFAVPITPDEGSYAYVARVWSGEYQLYRNVPFNRAPPIFLIYKCILAVIGTSIVSIRLGGALYNAASLVALFCLTQAVFSRRAAWITALVYGIASASPHVEGFTANAELFTTLPLILAAYFTWKEKWGWAGFTSGTAFLVKQIGVSGLLLAVVWLVVVRAPWRQAVSLGLGFAIGPLATVVYGYAIGWHYFWTAFIQHALLTNSFLGKPVWYQVGAFFALGLRAAPSWMIPGVLSAAAITDAPTRARLFGVLWIISSCLGIAMGGGPWRHYFFQLIPPLAFLSGAGLIALPHLQPRWFWKTLLTLGFVVFVVWSLPLWFAPPQGASWKLYKSPPLQLAADVSAYVASQSGEQDTIYVAFSQAQIYYVAHRRAQPVQLFWYEVANSQDIYDQVAQSIRSREPALIIWVQPPPSNRATAEEFEKVVREGYAEARRFGSGDPRSGGIIVYRRKPGSG